MLRKLYSFTVIFSFVFAVTHHIPDQYPTIQEGINIAEQGDTVLVAQGIYYENLILEKEITLASYAINEELNEDWLNSQNIQSTIISGSQTPLNSKQGSCLIIKDNLIAPLIFGFTFQDGSGTSMKINDCGIDKIKRSGGAILIFKAYPKITYNRFINNGTPQIGGGSSSHMLADGGAISHYSDEDVEFDEDRLRFTINSSQNRIIPNTMLMQNNYFDNNSSGDGENFYSHGYDGDIDVSGSIFENIDCNTSSVNSFVLQSIENKAIYLQNDIIGSCVEENIFHINSVDGNDINPGTETEPFSTIKHALTMVKESSPQVTVLHLQAGVYSRSTNGESFPIVVPDNVHIIGEDSETVFIDAESDINDEAAVMIIKEVENVNISNLTLTGGYSEGHGCTGGGGLLLTANDMYNLDAENGERVRSSFPLIEDVIIENNYSHNGGGLSFFRVNGPVLNNIIIRNNVASAYGGGIFSYVSTITMTNVTITENENINNTGGGMMLAASQGVFDNMIITNNISGMHGGGIWTNNSGGDGNYSEGWTMKNSTISGNVSSMFGGGINFAWSHPTLINCVISNNQSSWGGGGINGLESGFTIKESLVHNNFSYGGGGGILAWGAGADPVIDNCIISDNISGSNGGGIMLNGVDEATINYTSVIGNSAQEYFGGMYVNDLDESFHNMTFSENSASLGGVVGIGENANIQLKNSIVWSNSVGGGNFGSTDGTGSVDFTYSNIEGGFMGEGNISLDPLFKDVSNNDFTLEIGSPCIDAGIADLDADGVDDIDDYNGLSPDMGAYETSMAAVNGFTVFNTPTSIILSWEAIENSAFLYYYLERSTTEDFTENSVGFYINTNYYHDSEVDYETEYFYRVSFYADGWSEFSETLSMMLEWLDTNKSDDIPDQFSLHQNYPNPFNPTTQIRYDLPEDAFVNISIYDLMGRMIKSLSNANQTAGYHSLQWDATNNIGESVSAGMYIYTIQAGEYRSTKKMVLLK